MTDSVTPKTDTGCPHRRVLRVAFALGELQLDGSQVRWCETCGSIAVGAGAWQAPTGIVLPGWRCRNCHAFTGVAKKELTECRSCGTPRPAAASETVG